MSDELGNSICALAQGDEKAAAKALGGSFILESCGFFSNCDHRVERYDFSSGKETYVEMYYCSTDVVKVGGVVAVVLVALFLLIRKMKKRTKMLRQVQQQV